MLGERFEYGRERKSLERWKQEEEVKGKGKKGNRGEKLMAGEGLKHERDREVMESWKQE